VPFLSKSELQNLISEGRTRKAIDSLLKITKSLEDNELHNEVILQSSKFEKYQKQGRKGTTTFENQDISIFRINNALLQIIDKLPHDFKKTLIKREDNQKKKPIWKYVVLFSAVLATLAVFAIVNRFNLTENPKQKSKNMAVPTNPTLSQNSIFQADDPNHFNVLIIRFEDYIAGEDTYCIGRAVEEHLNVIAANENLSLSLSNIYVSDSILPPKSQQEAMDIQKRHHSDLIIYGLARQVEQNCAGAEVCFRYKIAENVIANVAIDDNIKSSKHDSEYKQTTPIEIEDGNLQIDSLSMKYWIRSLVNIKANKIEKTISDLRDLTERNINILSNKHKSIRHFRSGSIYLNLKKYERAINDFDEAIQLDPENVRAYLNRGNAYYYLKEYQRAIYNYDKVIQIDANDAHAYNNRGVAYGYLKKYKRAIDDFDKAIQVEPDYALAYIGRGITYNDLKKYQSAIDDFIKANQLDPNNHRAYNGRGNSYYYLKEYNRAIDD